MKPKDILLFLAAIMLASSSLAQISQDLYLYEKKGKYEVRGMVDGKILMKEADASGAMNAAIEMLAGQNGGELKISSGTYLIHAPVELASGTSLEGSGDGTVLKLGKGNEQQIIILANKVEGVRVSRMLLQGTDDKKRSCGIVFNHVGMGMIREVYARDFGQYGIWLRNDCFMCEVNSCQTAGNDSAGIYLSHNNWSGRGGNSVPNLITSCKSYGEDGHAFELFRSTCINLVGNIVYQCRGHGFYLHDHSCSNLISGSRVFSGFSNAIYCNRAHEVNISSNIFCWNRGHGIEIENTIWGTVAGNNIIDNGDVVDYDKGEWKTGKRYGVYLHGDTRSLQVSSNAIFNWPDGHPPMIDGIYEAEECQSNNINNNNVQFYTGSPANVNGKNSINANNTGEPDFYTEPWVGPFQPEKDRPSQVLAPLSRDVVDKMLEKTRK